MRTGTRYQASLAIWILWLSNYCLLFSQGNFLSIEELSQKTNQYLGCTNHNQFFVSSTDGLNIFDGLHTKVYRPTTHNMFGQNVQSAFFEDSTGKVWFTTYEALHVYDPRTDDLEYTFMISPGRDTVRSNYKAFHLENEMLYLKAGTNVFLFNVYTQRQGPTFDFNFRDRYQLAVVRRHGNQYIFGGGKDGYHLYQVRDDGSAQLVISGQDAVSSIFADENGLLWLGHPDGDFSLLEPSGGQVIWQDRISTTKISGITGLSGSRLMIALAGNELCEFDIPSRKVIDNYPVIQSTTGVPVKNLISPYLARDSTLWVGGDGDGVFFTHLKKRKFIHFLGSGPDMDRVSITRIIPAPDENLIVLTRVGGIYLISRDGEILYHWRNVPGSISPITSLSGVLLDPQRLLFVSADILYVLDLKSKSIQKLEARHDIPNFEMAQLERLQNGKLVASCYQYLLMEIMLDGNIYRVKPYAQLQMHSGLTTYFKESPDGKLWVSDDEVNLMILDPLPDHNGHIFKRSLPIKGGIRSLAVSSLHPGLFIGNTTGLFHIDPVSFAYERMKNDEGWFDQAIYSMQSDDHGIIWMGTNKGLLNYNPSTRNVKVFSTLDGIQAAEYNTHASLVLPDGYMCFGGVNGLNYFHPAKVNLSNEPAPVWISKVLINDEPDTQYRVPQYCTEYSLPYSRNTISLSFHAIDYADPDATRVKYKLVGVDHDYIVSDDAEGFARYANLWPGHYTLSIVGANSDGVWNTEAREISIIVKPPFYLTWWFIAAAALAVLGFAYYGIRSYYRRKLERKNQLLREQALIIEKQQAIEHERTRIASEMHDDLGSGLTTIRYLSDKALQQAKDAEERAQIKRIAEHSNSLVRNMSEIIWAMNARFDTTGNLISYLRRFASEYLAEHDRVLHFDVQPGVNDAVPITGEKRRNVFLVFKELLHNTVKHSDSREVRVDVSMNDVIRIRMVELGAPGFDPSTAIEKGNGLYNSVKRMSTIRGEIRYEKSEEGMTYLLTVPV